jgi:carbon-monoxide dehydrogenase small subunit
MKLNCNLNGEPLVLEIETNALLVDVIRGLGKTGTKEGCGVGVCGLCTVMVDDVPVSSCIYLAACANEREIWTIEGIAERDPRVIDAFVEHEGMQCGICTPGQVVSAYALRQAHPDADDDKIREFMAGNLCRCTGYVSIFDSVKAYLNAK